MEPSKQAGSRPTSICNNSPSVALRILATNAQAAAAGRGLTALLTWSRARAALAAEGADPADPPFSEMRDRMRVYAIWRRTVGHQLPLKKIEEFLGRPEAKKLAAAIGRGEEAKVERSARAAAQSIRGRTELRLSRWIAAFKRMQSAGEGDDREEARRGGARLDGGGTVAHNRRLASAEGAGFDSDPRRLLRGPAGPGPRESIRSSRMVDPAGWAAAAVAKADAAGVAIPCT